MQTLSCRSCGTEVLVRKNSQAQTSVQWRAGSESCAEFAERLLAGGPPRTVIMPTCLRLRDSIEDAVRTGVLPVSQP